MKDFVSILFYLGMKIFQEQLNIIQGISRVIISPTELKKQSTIHMRSKPGYCPHLFPGLLCKCIVGCIKQQFFLTSST
jgi:hypothetical protein